MKNINRKIALSALSILGALALIGGATLAFFSDIETSTGNVFAAGEIDLEIDNTSYYNGVASPNTSWTLTDLTIEKFFNFDDVKPADYGEDTISLHVSDNDAWACADVTLTSDLENDRTANETAAGDGTDDPNGGELADAINFLWWADDGDNVLEEDEEVLPGGPLGALAVGQTATVAIADSNGSIYESGDLNADGALEGGADYFIGKAWCFGTISAAALQQDDYSGPDDDNNGDQTAGTPSDGGINCDGSQEGNETQTDSLTADVSFRAVQSRNNSGFLCNPQASPSPSPTPLP